MAISRTAYRKAIYFAIVGGGAVVFLTVARYFAWSSWAIVILVVLFLTPGRILGYFWKDQMRGLRLLREKQYEESIRHSRAFLDQLERKPWIKHLIWLGSGTYTRNPRSFAFNNIGAAEIGLGRFEAARSNLEEAIRQDDLNPLPFYNLSILAKKEGNAEEMAQMLSAAYARGLTFGLTDKIIMSSQKRFAATDGQGTRS